MLRDRESACRGRAGFLLDRRRSRLSILGIDLVGMFAPYPASYDFLRMQEASVLDLVPDCSFDLITCVHGLHYVGDKLELIRKAASWLKEDGYFAANLDPANLRLADGATKARTIIRDLRKNGVDYSSRKHLLTCHGKRVFDLSYEYLGADDKAGPNYTGQAAVDSHYSYSTDRRTPRL
jgi:SAM-dependent methyltransferase